jgi:dGTPase
MSIDQDLIDYAREKEHELQEAALTREHIDAEDDRASSGRDDADRDYARVLYSSAFRRLQDKMQLFSPRQNRFHRNRLTHSLEVAQIAKIIAKKAQLQDTLTVQTCALAHDIGNPPFGHYGEGILNELQRQGNNSAGFEGNAQTFRVLTTLEEKHYDYNGLNLTWRTLFGVVKYPNDNLTNETKYLYQPDWDYVKNSAKNLNVTIGLNNDRLIRTIDAEIMDIADEIAYAAHDLHDALKQGYFTIDELIHEFSMSKEYGSSLHHFIESVNKAREFASKANSYGTSEEYSSLFLRELSSEIVNKLVSDVGIINNSLNYKNYEKLAIGLKKLTYAAVSRKRDIKQYELMGEKVIRGLFQVYSDTSYNKQGKLLPMDYVKGYKIDFDKDGSPIPSHKSLLKTAITDYIAGMMDSFAIEQYQKYFGETDLNKLYFRSSDFT